MPVLPPYAPPDVNRALPSLPVFNILLATVSTLVVTLRIYTRTWLKNCAGWDDFLIVPGLIFALGFTAGTMVEIYNGGYGHHSRYVDLPSRFVMAKTNTAINLILPASLFFSRASICLLLLRLVSKFSWRWFLHGAQILNAMVCVGTILIFGFICVPVEKGWDHTITGGHCMGFETLDKCAKVFAGFNVLIDFICAGVPFVVIRSLQLNNKARLGLYAILCGGVVVAACSIGRIVALNFRSLDKTWDLVPLTFWSLAEAYGAIMFASLPALHQLWRHLRQEKTLRRSMPISPKPYMSWSSSPSAKRFFSPKIGSDELATTTTRSAGFDYIEKPMDDKDSLGIGQQKEVVIEVSPKPKSHKLEDGGLATGSNAV